MINKTASLVVKRHGKVFWQFFSSDAMAIDAYYIYACDHTDFSYSIWLTSGDKIRGTVPAKALAS